MKALLRKIRQILKDRRTRRFLTRVVSGVAAVVVFVTTYALVLPAITMESQAACGIEAHQHDDSCYSENLICGQEESEGHHHTEDCYTVTRELECNLEEHEHSSENGCFDEEGNLVCKLEEHIHSDSCYKEHRELTCGMEESDGHHHTDSCYEKVLTCGKEVHTHSAACYKADLEIESAAVASTGMTSAAAVPDLSDEDYYSGDSEDDALVSKSLDVAEQTDADEEHVDAEVSPADNSEHKTGTDSDADIKGENPDRDNIKTGSGDADQADEKDKGKDKSDSEEGEEAASSFSTGFAADEDVENGDAYIPDKDALDFSTVLNRKTGIYYHHVEEDEDIEDSSAITDWIRADEDTELNPGDIIRAYLSYTLPKDTINATNDISRYRLPDTLHLTDDQIEAINSCENGISAQYIDYDNLEITDPERHAAYLGLESVEGSRLPGEELKEDSQEYISAVVRAEKIYDEDTGEYEGTDLIFTFSPYAVEKNAHEYDRKGQPTRAGEEVTGWLTLDFNMGQIDWAEDKTSEIVFAKEDKISTVLRQADSADDETDESAKDGATEAASEYATDEAAAAATTAEIAAEDSTQAAAAETAAAAAATTSETASESNSARADAGTQKDSENEKDKNEKITAASYPAAVFDDSITVRSGRLDTDLADTDIPKKTKMIVHVEADEGTFPEGTKMVLSAVEDLDAVAEAVGTAVDSKTRGFQAVDITFYDKDPSAEDAKEIEPLKPIRVSIKSDEIKKAAEDSSTAPVVVHIEDDNTATEVESTASKTDSGTIEIEKPAADPDSTSESAGQSNDNQGNESEKNTDSQESDSPAASNAENEDESANTQQPGDTEDSADTQQPAGTEEPADTQQPAETEEPADTQELGDTEGSANTQQPAGTEESSDTDKTADKVSGNEESADTASTGDTVDFEAASFSVYAIVYTVDFHWEVNGKMYEFSLPGGGFVSFENLIEVLGISHQDVNEDNQDEKGSENDENQEDSDIELSKGGTDINGQDVTGKNDDQGENVPLTLDDVEISGATREFVADVESIMFSTPELLSVSKVDESTTVGTIKESLGLDCKYSGDLTEEQIAEINNTVVESGDWALISMLPFNTEETLTVTMKTGEVFEIRVTDTQDPLGIDDRTVAFVVTTSDTAGVSVQSAKFNTDLAGRTVNYKKVGTVEYCDKDASVWLFEYDPAQQAYYITNGYHTDGSTRYLAMNFSNNQVNLESSKQNALPVKIERNDDDGTYKLYIDNGTDKRYLTYNPTYNSFWASPTDQNTSFHFCMPENSGENASHKATLISAQDTQPGQRLVVYTRIWGYDANGTQVAYYYAIDADGNLVPVDDSSDSIYWRGDKYIEWELTDVGSGYYTLSTLNSQGQKVYLVPKSDGYVFSEDYEAFEGDSKHFRISLPGRDLSDTDYTSQIASWDYIANTTYGLKVKQTEGKPLTPVEYLKADEFYFATRDPIVQGELTEVDTVSSKAHGITIQMYDFSGATASHDGNRLQFMSDVLTDDEWLPYELHQGLTKRVLENGFPVSAQSGKNLSEIFNSSNSTYKGEADQLFLLNPYNETGFYKYSCFENYAYFNEATKEFSVYEQIGTPYAPNGGTTSHWTKTNNFGDTYYFPEDKSGVDTREGMHTYYQRGNFMPYNTLNPNNPRQNLYDPDLIELDDSDPRRNEDLYVINGSGNYFFGMIMSAKFIQNPGGVSDHGDPMVFEFNGDDDMWVYVDDVLLLDMGGVHDAFRGKIDFNTGDIYVNGQVVLDTTQSHTASSNHAVNPHTTIKEQFWKAGKFPDGSTWDDENDPRVADFFSGNTFKDFTTHNFKMFYMERGAGASNLEMQFNLPILTESQFRVKKDMPETQDHQAIQNNYANATFYYEAWVKDITTNQMTKVTRSYLNQLKEQNKIKDATPRYDDEDRTPVRWKSDSLDETKFELKPGMMALFPAVDDSVEWYVVEVEPDDESHMLDSYKVSNSDQDTSVDNGTKSNQKTILKRNTVIFYNRPEDKLVNELRITKDIIGEPYNENDAFELRIFLESTNGKMVAYSMGEYYQIDKDGKYVYYVNGARTLSDTPRLAEHTSMNGSLGDFREGDTIIIKGLLEGTDFYVYERTNYDYMSKDENPAAGAYTWIDTEVEDAYIRATDTTPAQNVPENLTTGHLYDDTTGLSDLFIQYNTSAYEKKMAAAGSIIQNKDAKVLVKNRPSDLVFEKKWVKKGGEEEYTPTDADAGITVTAKLKGTKTTTTTTYTEEFTTTYETQLVDDELIPVTLVGQAEGEQIWVNQWYSYWQNRFNDGQETVLTTVNVRKGSTLKFSVGINGTTSPTYTPGTVQHDSSGQNLTYHSADSLSGNTTWTRNNANVFKLENITEPTTILAKFDGNQSLGNNGIGYCIVEADTTPNKVEREVPVTTSHLVPHTETSTQTSEKTVTLSQENGWKYDLNNDPDVQQGWTYVIDSTTIQEQNATGYNFISTPVVTTDEEGNTTYTCTNEKQTTVDVEKTWSPELTGTDADGAYVTVELHRYVKLRGAFTVKLTTDEADVSERTPIKGAKFRLYRVVADGEDEIVTDNLYTDENGEVSVANLTPGTYYYVQTADANGYSMENHTTTTETFTVTDDNPARQEKTVTLTNSALTPVGVFQLTLKDNIGRPVQGATFQLYKDGSVVSGAVYTTDESGSITVSDLEEGTYFLRQLTTPSDYKMPNNTDTITLVVDQPGLNSASWEMTNTCKGKGIVTVTLRRADNNDLIRGAGFTLYKGSEVVASGTTDANGQVVFGSAANKLEAGEYSLVQTSAPGNLVKAATRPVTIQDNGDPDQNVTVNVTNVADTGNITINLYRAQGAIVDSSGSRAKQNSGENEPYATNRNYKPGDIVTVKITTGGANAAYCTDYTIETPYPENPDNHEYWGTFQTVTFADNEFTFTFEIPQTPREATYNLACSSGWSTDALDIEFVNPPSGNRSASRMMVASARRADSAPLRAGEGDDGNDNNGDPSGNDSGSNNNAATVVVPSKPDGYIEDSSFEVQSADLSANDDPAKNWKHIFTGLDMTDSDGNPYYYYIVETACHPENYHVSAYSDAVDATAAAEDRKLTVTNQAVGKIIVKKSFQGVEEADLNAFQNGLIVTVTGPNAGGEGVNTKNIVWSDGLATGVVVDNLVLGETYNITESFSTDSATQEALAKYAVVSEGAVDHFDNVVSLIHPGTNDTKELINKYTRGSLTVNKEVLKDGSPDSNASGTFWFAVYAAEDVNPATEAADNTPAAPASPRENTTPVWTGSISVSDGTGDTTVPDLYLGDYYVFELTGQNGNIVTGSAGIGGKYYQVTGSGSTATVSAEHLTDQSVTVSNDYETTSKTATKSWADLATNTNPTHPTIYFKIYYSTSSADVAVTGAELKELPNGTTTVTWQNLLKYDENGNEYVYHVKEYIQKNDGEYEENGVRYTEAAPNGYVSKENGLTITNTESETYDPRTSYSGRKVWVDTSNGGETRPDFTGITVKLMVDKTGDGASSDDVEAKDADNHSYLPNWVELENSDNVWIYTFANIPVFDAQGNYIHYYVVEEPVTGYSQSGNQVTPTQYTYLNQINGEQVTNDATIELSAEINKLAFVAIKINAYEKNYHIWTVRETSEAEKQELISRFNTQLGSQNATLENTRFVSGLPVSKLADGNVEFLYKSDNPRGTGYKIRISKKDSSTIQVGVDNHEAFDYIYVGTLEYSYNAGSTVLTNTLETVDYDVQKTWGSGQAAPEGAEVEITLSATIPGTVTVDNPEPDPVSVNLTDVGVTKEKATLNGGRTGGDDTTEHRWIYSWTGLPKYDKDGHEITYIAAETSYKIDGETIDLSEYAPTTSHDGTYELIATNEIPKTTFEVTKTWINDNNNLPPEGASITVTLYKGETAETAATAVSSIVLNGTADYNGTDHVEGEPENENAYEDSTWHALWKNLPMYESNGKLIYYIAKETVTWDGYAVSYEDPADQEPAENGTPGEEPAGEEPAGEETPDEEPLEKEFALDKETITNSKSQFEFDILKVKEGTTDPLPGASFTIRLVKESSNTTMPEYEGGSKPSDPETTGEDGKTAFTDVAPGYYEVLETKTPDGYIFTGDAAFYIKVEPTGISLLEKEVKEGKLTFKEASTTKVGNVTIDKEGTSVTFTVENTPGAALPHSGGPGTNLFTLFGIMLTGIAGAGLMMRKRRKAAKHRL